MIYTHWAMVEKFGHKIAAVLVLGSSVAALMPLSLHEALLSHRAHLHIAHTATLAFGFLALYLSVQVAAKKRLAFWLALLTVSLLALLNILHGNHPWRVVLYVVTILVLVSCARVFTVKSSNVNTNRALILSFGIFMAAVVYGALGFYTIDKRAFNIDFTLFQALKYSFLQLVSFHDLAILPATRQAHLLLESLDALSVITYVLIAANLFKPIRFSLVSSASDRKQALALIQSSSRSVEDYFKLWPEDKHYYFNTAKTAFLAYKVSGATALVLDGPTGNRRAFSRLLADFNTVCHENGWRVAIIHADSEIRDVAGKLDMHAVFIGNEAIVAVPEFCATTARSKHFRYVKNKAEREGLAVEFWEPPLSTAQVQALQTISDAWLSIPGRREYTFVMGYFDEEYLRQSEVAVLRQNETPIAYTNLIPSYVKGQRSIDHMRHTPDMPSIGMHFLIKSLLEALQQKKMTSLNLGLSPLSGITEVTDPTIVEQLLSSIKTFGSRYYSFAGLEQFKNKFKPGWQPRYLLYQGAPTNLIAIASSLNKATALHSTARRAWIGIGLSLFAGLGYLSFVLAYPLGIASHGLASELGAQGAPYAWVFNGLDVVVGAVVTYLAVAALKQASSARQRLMALLFAGGGVGNALAALTPLNGKLSVADVHFSTYGLHAFFSVLSILGFCGASYLFALTARRYRRLTFGLLALLFGVTLLSLLSAHLSFGGVVQRVQLCLVALFIALVGVRLAK